MLMIATVHVSNEKVRKSRLDLLLRLVLVEAGCCCCCCLCFVVEVRIPALDNEDVDDDDDAADGGGDGRDIFALYWNLGDYEARGGEVHVHSTPTYEPYGQ